MESLQCLFGHFLLEKILQKYFKKNSLDMTSFHYLYVHPGQSIQIVMAPSNVQPTKIGAALGIYLSVISSPYKVLVANMIEKVESEAYMKFTAG